MRRKVPDGWLVKAEVARRLGITAGAIERLALKRGIRRLIRPDLPILFHAADVAAYAAQCRVEGEGIAATPEEATAS